MGGCHFKYNGNIGRTFIYYDIHLIYMGFVSDLVNGDSSNGYAELTDADLRDDVQNGLSIGFVDVKSQDDLVNAKEALHDGTIVFLDVAYVESNGMSLESVYAELQETVESVNGDIVHKTGNDVLVATPRDVPILRDKI
jgi:SepF-like predicted cell division protein (DUF552 family)